MKFKKRVKTIIKDQLNKLPYINTLHKVSQNNRFPQGHFYSTVVSLDEIKTREDEIWKDLKDDTITGIDLKAKDQLVLINCLKNFLPELPYSKNNENILRFQQGNGYYDFSDAVILYTMIRHLRPNRIIEIGSGFSSAIMLDINEIFFGDEIDLTFIEPYPNERLNRLIGQKDTQRCRTIDKNVQLVPLETFEALEPGDILFVDSSHAVKTGSDVNYILFEIIPKLKRGVHIHFHDIFYPFEYPKDWVFSGFGWNEAYFLKAFLMYNNNFEIQLFTDYLHKFHNELISEMNLSNNGTGSSLWIKKM